MATANTNDNTSVVDTFESPPGDRTSPPGDKTRPLGDETHPHGKRGKSPLVKILPRQKKLLLSRPRHPNDDIERQSKIASDEDICQLLKDPPGQTSDNVATTTNEDELLKQLEADLKDEDESGPSINQQLANIANKRWGAKLSQEKLTAILPKYIRPENCPIMNVTRVNTEIWQSINSTQRKADLRLANLQQVLQKGIFATLSTANKLLPLKTTNTTNPADVNEMLGNCIDTIALVGHPISELSQIRREKLKPSLKAEYHSLCTTEVSPESKLLFGDDLAKQIRDKNETNRIGHAVASTSTKRDSHGQRYSHSWQNKQDYYRGTSSGSGRQPPFRKGYHPPKRKKQRNQTPAERGKK